MSENQMAFVVVAAAAAAVAIGGAAVALTYRCCQDLSTRKRKKIEKEEQGSEEDNVNFDLSFDEHHHSEAEGIEQPTPITVLDSSTSKPTVRTVEDIKARYGRPSKKTSTQTSSIASEARNKLMERGEKLQAVNEKTQELQSQAENFSSLAEELANKMKNRKWWQL